MTVNNVSRRLHSGYILFIFSILIAGCTLPPAIEGAFSRLDTSPRACDGTPFVVTLTTDAGDGVCNSQCTLREAIKAANECPGMDEIQLLEGDMTLTQPGPGNDRGDLDITDDVRIVGVPSSVEGNYVGFSIVRGGDHWNQRIFHIHPEATVEMEWLEVIGGHEDEEGEYGGGILNEGHLTTDHVSIEQNTAWAGGGLYNTGIANLNYTWVGSNEALNNFEPEGLPSSPLRGDGSISCGGGIANTLQLSILNDTIIKNNKANIGAGVCNVRGVFEMESGRIEANAFDPPHAWLGGGIFNDGGLYLSGVEIRSNRARAGAGIHSWIHELGSVNIGSSIIENNIAAPAEGGSFGYGGGLFLGRGPFTLDNLVIRENQAEIFGGGVYLGTSNPDRLPTGTLTQSVLYDNQAGFIPGSSFVGSGGGIYLSPNVEAEIENTTFSGNEASGDGAGMYFRGGSLEIRYATFADNRAGRSGHDLATSNLGGMTVLGTVFFQSNGDSSCFLRRPPFSLGWNIEANGHTCINGRDNPSDLVNVDPTRLLEPTLSSTGFSWVHHVPIGSDAFERIPPEECLVLEDQIGESRPFGNGCEVGAVEEPATGLAPVPSATPAAITAATTTAPTSKEGTTNGNAFCRRGPSTVYADIDSMVAGVVVPITGRNQDSSWLVITGPNSGRDCWIAFSLLDLSFPSDQVAQLPVIPAPPTPVPTSEPTATHTPVPVPPAAPSNLTISNRVCTSEEYSLQLSWNDAANNEIGYRVYRGGQQIAELGAGATSYSDNPPYGGPYSYSVEAYNSAGKASASVQEQGCIY